jgi:sigma-E factor negative regulatory protein RseC
LTQNAVIVRIVDENTVEIALEREPDCGQSCSSCGAGCPFKNIVTVQALNRIGAKEGDCVVVESKKSWMAFLEFVAYLVPLILFFIGYALSNAFSASEEISILISACAFAVGVVAALIFHRIAKNNFAKFDLVSFR